MQLLEKIKPLWTGRPILERRILVVNGHPDPAPERFCSALCDAYEDGAHQAGWTLRRLTVGQLSNNETRDMALEALRWATQLVVVYPLWLDQPPVPLRDLFEDYLCRNRHEGSGVSEQPMHLVITMDMPAFLYRAMLQCDIDVKGLARGMTLPGFRHQHQDFIGSIASITPEQRNRWLKTMRDTGLRAV
jgi:putative NADPH-quinone reductase